MITTGCEGCCFLQSGDKGKGCSLMQLCVTKDNQTYAPGYCRMCRSHKWAKKQGDKSIQGLYQNVIIERAVKFDMLVFFDEAIHTIDDLRRTLDDDWYSKYAEKIIIMDVTGFGNRQNLAMQYLDSRDHIVPTVVDSSAENESPKDKEDTLRRVSSQVTSPFFLSIPAGGMVRGFDMLMKHVQLIASRVIHWSIPIHMGDTAIVSNLLCYGLFITSPYKSLVRSIEADGFTDSLRKEEAETDMGLSWLCQVARIA